MQTDLDQSDDSEESPLITDPIIKRYASKLHQLTQELISETEHYELNRTQISQFIDSLTTFRAILVMAEDLERLDAMLRVTFPDDYYSQEDNMMPFLSEYPLSTIN